MRLGRSEDLRMISTTTPVGRPMIRTSSHVSLGGFAGDVAATASTTQSCRSTTLPGNCNLA